MVVRRERGSPTSNSATTEHQTPPLPVSQHISTRAASSPSNRGSRHHLIGDPAGIRSYSVAHDLMLFPHEEYEDAFRDAGCVVTRVPDWPVGRSLYGGVQEGNA